MTFTIPQLIKALSHPSACVREQAVYALVDVRRPARMTADDVWGGIDAGQLTLNRKLAALIGDVPNSVDSIRRVIHALEQHPKDVVARRLHDAFANTAIADVGAVQELVSQTRVVPKEVRERLKRRAELSKLGPMELWQQYLRVACPKGDARPNHRETGDHLAALTPHAELTGLALSMVQDPAEQDWPEIAAMEALAVWRCSEAFAAVAAYLSDEDAVGDFMFEACLRVIREIATPETMREMAGLAGERPFAYGLALCNGIESTLTDEMAAVAEELLARLTPEDDLYPRAMLLPAKLGFGTPAYVDRCLAFLDEYMGLEANDLRGPMVAMAEHLGYAPDAIAPWVDLERREQDSLERALATRNLGKLNALPPAVLPRYYQDDSAADASVADANYSSTVVNREKVGRNDPCPCKSGKKYKKCCGRD
jgi:hypothetical protein